MVDTNVWSELRNRRGADGQAMRWAETADPARMYLSVVTVFELERGVLRMERRDPEQGSRLRRWLEQHVLEPFKMQILPIDTAIARRAAALHLPDPPPERDALIAATALIHGLTVATRNVGDFKPMGVDLFDPWYAAET